jgi:hypothetical protein
MFSFKRQGYVLFGCALRLLYETVQQNHFINEDAKQDAGDAVLQTGSDFP